jgi:hypothetical protein
VPTFRPLRACQTVALDLGHGMTLPVRRGEEQSPAVQVRGWNGERTGDARRGIAVALVAEANPNHEAVYWAAATRQAGVAPGIGATYGDLVMREAGLLVVEPAFPHPLPTLPEVRS